MKGIRLRSALNGAAAVYARNQALSYLEKPDPPGHAEVTTFITDGNNLDIYAHYATQSDDRTEYHQYPVRSIKLTDSYEEFKIGQRALRNEQDHARDVSFNLRDDLNEYWGREQDLEQQ